MRRIIALLIALLVAAPAVADVQLDLSGGFNMDCWLGPLEMQAIMAEYPAYGHHDLQEVQGSNAAGVGWWVQYQSTMMVGNSSAAYSIPGAWFHPRTVSGTTGTPEDGALTGASYAYHISSYGGNATYAGDMLEVASPSFVWDHVGGAIVTPMNTRYNAMVVGSSHSTASWQIASTTATLPVAQQGQYASINFALAAHGSADGARNMQIVAVYGDASEDILYTFSALNERVGPVMDDSVAEGANYDPTEFAAVYTFDQTYSSSSGASGTISNDSGTMFEFADALSVDPTRVLVGIRIEDSDPGLNWNARGLTVFGASGELVPEPATMALLGLGMLGLMLGRRRK